MIRYALACGTCDHAFDAWFASSETYDSQAKRRLIACPECDGDNVAKQIMAPAVRKSAGAASEVIGAPSAAEAFARRARDYVAENFDYVGDDFAAEARAMYFGETDDRPIWGETTAAEREALEQDAIPASPLPAPFAPKRPKRRSRATSN